MVAADSTGERAVSGTVRYFGGAPGKPAFHAKDHRRDNWSPDIQPVLFHDARAWAVPPSLRREGVTLAPHPTAVRDFGDRDEVRRVYVIFRAYGNEPSWIAGAPHVAFDDPSCPASAGPRISVEARAYAVFDAWPPAHGTEV